MKTKEIKLKDREFVLCEPTPKTGCAIYNMLASYKIPFGADIVVGQPRRKRPAMNTDELDEFMNICLQNCYEPLGDKKAPVIDSDGGIGIREGVPPLLTQITVQYMLFFIDYWAEELGLDLSPDSPGTSSQNRRT